MLERKNEIEKGTIYFYYYMVAVKALEDIFYPHSTSSSLVFAPIAICIPDNRYNRYLCVHKFYLRPSVRRSTRGQRAIRVVLVLSLVVVATFSWSG